MARVLDSVTMPIKKNGTTTPQEYVNNPKSTAPQFSALVAYAAGQIVFYEKKLYRFKTAHPAGAWNSAHVEEITVASELVSHGADITELKADLSENVADLNNIFDHISENKTANISYLSKKILDANGNIAASNTHALLYGIHVVPGQKITVTSARYSSWTTAGPLIAFYSTHVSSEIGASTCVEKGATHNNGNTYTETYTVPETAVYAVVQSCDSYGDPTVTIESINVLNDIAALKATLGEETVSTFTKTGSSNATKFIPYTIPVGKTIMFKWQTAGGTNQTLNLFTRNSSTGSNIETVKTTAHPNIYYKFTSTLEASGLFLSATYTGTIYIYDLDTVVGRLENVETQVDRLSEKASSTPLVKFNFSDIMYDPSTIFAEGGEMGDVSAWPNGGADALSKVHNAFDALIAQGGAGYGYGERITGLYKESVEDSALFDILAPSYVTNGVTQGETVTLDIGVDTSNNPVTYQYTYESSTDPYEVRLYKFHDTNSALHTQTVDIPKKKLLLIGGTHGNEFCAPINLYVFAKHLCTDYENPDVLKLRSSYDVYIIPYLNGFGCQYKWDYQGHISVGSRSNGHMVDINRNCETLGWVGATGTAEQITANFESKIANLGLNTFAGASNGSEFESKLLKDIINWLKPDVVIDHHHNEGTNPFYTICYGNYASNLIYQAANDVAYAMHHRMASYYGTDYNLYLSSSVSPATKAASNGYVTTMAYEQGVKMNATTEMSQSISYLNGVYDATTRQETKFGSDVFKISEYSLLNVLLHLCQYAMEH